MIKAEELRKGNYVTYHDPEEGDMSNQVDCEDIAKIDEDPEYAALHSPIAITEEIFLAAGFEKSDYPNFSLKVGAIKLRCRIQIGICYAELENIYLADKIRYVHQLQNLYHVLLGTELKIKL